MEREFSAAESGSGPYNDSNFLLSDKINNYGNTDDQIYRAHHMGCKTENKTFVKSPGPDDIAQGEAGDCWFLSSLCAFVTDSGEGIVLNFLVLPSLGLNLIRLFSRISLLGGHSDHLRVK